MKRAVQYFTQDYIERSKKLTPTEIADFLEDYRKVFSLDEGKKKLISMRVPEKLLELFRKKAQLHGQKYQSKIVDLMRSWVFDQDGGVIESSLTKRRPRR